jgi:FMN phosphatase YigB (HAD superfamily)
MARVHPIVFLVDVDNTLLDNDGVQQDLKDHVERVYGRDARDRYWRILEDLFSELGYRDYLGALQRFRAEHPLEVELLSMSAYLIDYPFAGRLFPSALKVLRRLKGLGSTVILSDGDVVFQPRKVERAGLSDAVDGRVLIYIHSRRPAAS